MRAPLAISHAPRAVNRDANAISIGPRLPCENGDLVWGLDSASLKSFAQNLLLQPELSFISAMLVAASAAHSKVMTARFGPVSGTVDDRFGFRGGITSLVFNDANASPLARKTHRNERCFPFDTREECTAVNGLLDLDDLRLRAS